MQVGLLLIAFGLKTIAIPVPLDDLFASISSSSDDLFSPDNSLLSGSLGTGDQLIAATSPDLQWDSQDSDLLLASTEPSLFDEQLASSGTCDEFQSSLDSYDDLDPLIARDVADLFPGLNELTAPLNELKKAPACSIPNNPKKPSRPKQQVDPNTPPDNIAPDLFIMVGLEEGQCPTTHPVPLYCEGPWFNFNYVRGCTPFLQTLLMYAAVLDSFCCQNFEPLSRAGERCVQVQWGGNARYYSPPITIPGSIPGRESPLSPSRQYQPFTLPDPGTSGSPIHPE